MTITYPAEAAGRIAVSTRPRSSFERKYRAAVRHSLLVRVLRFGTIAGIATVAIVVVGANYLPSLGELRIPGEIGKLVIKGTKITMEQPHLHGFTTDFRAYDFTADAAAQDINKPDLLELDKVHANMEMADKTRVKLTAANGLYNLRSETIMLEKDIVVTSSTGYQAFLEEAAVDMRKGHMETEKPVRIKLLNGFLNANRLEVIDNGDLLRFGGGVHVTLQPGSNAAKASDE